MLDRSDGRRYFWNCMRKSSSLWSRLIGAGERLYSGRRKLATVAAVGLAISLGYHVIFGQNGLTIYEQKKREARELDVELKRLQKENEQMSGHIERLQNDPSAIEHQAREELHYTRPGEVIYTLPAAPAKK